MGKNDTPNGTLAKLSSRQRRAVAALVSEPTLAEAARAAGVSRKTLYRYLSERGFREALAEAQGDVLRLSGARVAGLLSRSLDVVGEKLCASVGSAPLHAAGLVIRHGTALLEYASLEERVRALEEKAERDKARQ